MNCCFLKFFGAFHATDYDLWFLCFILGIVRITISSIEVIKNDEWKTSMDVASSTRRIRDFIVIYDWGFKSLCRFFLFIVMLVRTDLSLYAWGIIPKYPEWEKCFVLRWAMSVEDVTYEILFVLRDWDRVGHIEHAQKGWRCQKMYLRCTHACMISTISTLW